VYESMPLRDDHVLDTFDCGKPDLDTWLRDHARHTTRNNTARTFVWCEPGDPHVLAYFSLAGHLVEKEELPSSRMRQGSPRQSPAVLLARLALDKSLQGKKLGGVLLADALEHVAQAVAVVAARFVLVDAIDEDAATYYEKYGFKRIPGDTRLYRKVSDILADLA
jgi:GNAT superfamily N-acetyltransferase